MRLQVPVPLVMVTVVPVIEHEPLAVMTAALLALVVVATVNVDWEGALAGAPVKVTVGVALLTCRVTIPLAVV